MTMHRCIAADPPWNERGGGKIKRGADRHYPLMKKEDIAEVMRSVVNPHPEGCHLWLWVTDNHLLDGLWVLEQLGFRYIRTMAWVKMNPDLQIGLGQYLRGAHELCILASKGPAMVPAPENRMPSVVIAPRGKHSTKPKAAYDVIERVSPAPRLELFAREPREGWDVWGNEVTSTFTGETMSCEALIPVDPTVWDKVISLAKTTAEEDAAPAQNALSFAQRIDIQNQAQLEFSVKGVAEMIERKTALEDKRLEIGRALRAIIGMVDEALDPVVGMWAEGEDITRKKISEYVSKVEATCRAFERRAEEQTDETVRAQLLETVEKAKVGKVDGLSIVSKWTGTVTDAPALVKWAIANNQLHLLVPDKKALELVTKKADRDPEIPGWKPEHRTDTRITPGKVKR